MANTKSTQHEIDLTSELNLNKFKADIKQYQGFNEKNAPYYGGCLSPLFQKNDGNLGSNTQYYKGHKYSITNNTLYKDDSSILSMSNSSGHFTKEIISKSIDGEEVEIIDFYDDDNFIYRTIQNDLLYVCTGGYNLAISNFEQFVSSKFKRIGNYTYYIIQLVSSCFYGKSSTGYVPSYHGHFERLVVSGVTPTPTTWGFMNRDYLDINETYAQINSTFYDINNKKYLLMTCVPLSEEFFHPSDNPDIRYLYCICGSYAFQYYKNARPGQGGDGRNHFTKHYIGELKPIFDNTIFNSTYPFYTLFINENLCVNNSNSNRTTFGVSQPNANGYSSYNDIFSGSELSSSTFRVYAYNYIQRTFDGASSENLYSSSDGFKLNLFCGNTFNSMFQYSFATNASGISCGYSKNAKGQYKKIHRSGTFDQDGYQLKYYSTFTDDDSNVFPCSVGNIIDRQSNYRIIYSPEGTLLGISYIGNNGGSISLSGTLLTSWGSVASEKPVYVHSFYTSKITFYDSDLKKWVRISVGVGTGGFTIIDKYIVVNTTDHYNCVNLETLEREHWADDWNNFFMEATTFQVQNPNRNYYEEYWTDDPTLFPKKAAQIAGGKNVNYIENSIPSAKPAPVDFFASTDSSINLIGSDFNSYSKVGGNVGSSKADLDIYLNSKYLFTLYEYKTSGSATGFNTNVYSNVKSILISSTFPGDAVRNNIPILFSVIQGPLDVTIVNFGSDVSFFTLFYDNINRLEYYNGSITEFDIFFVIQGQSYGIARNKIYNIFYSNGVIQSSTPIVPIDGLVFIGNTIYNAYFYSKTTRAIYSFGADNNLSLFAQADTISGVTGATYMVGSGSIIIGTPECTYVLNEMLGIYRLSDIKNMKYADQLDGKVVIVTNDNYAYEISYEEQPLEEEGTPTGWVKNDVILDTAFYGAGSNVVSVNDCWYVRVTDPEHKTGEIKLSVSTLTDIGRQTETRTFKVKATDWDELTDTVYIRFQPKLQRAVGVSLHIESPFKVGYIGVGATPETLQLNKGTI